MKSYHERRCLCGSSAAVLAIASLFAAAPALAQQASPADDTPAAPQDIVVTAQKRAQNVQDVPIAVQVVSESQLQASGVRNFADLTKVAPSLVVRPAEQPVNSSISIRGIGTFAFSIAVEPSVAVQVDDVPIAFQARAFTNLSDIERIEVLRGPQSTLYGKSASAGLINIVTKGPSDHFTGRISGLATDDDEYQAALSLSGPLTDRLGFRVLGNWNRYRGNVRNVSTGEMVNGREDVTLRGKLRWTPTDQLTIDLGLDYADGSTTVGRPFVALSSAARLRGNAALTPAVFAPGITPSRTNSTAAFNFPSGTSYHDFQQSLRAAYDLDFATLISITSHDKFKLYDQLDVDDAPVAAVDTQMTGEIPIEQWTEELRIVSASDRPLRYTAGLFYSDVDYKQIRDRGPTFSLSHYTATARSIQKAAFLQLEYDVTPALTAIGGIRHGRDKVEYTFLDRQNGNAFFAGSDARSYTTYKANLQYKFSPTFNMFVTFATGRKGQTYDLSTGFNANRAAAGAVRPETSEDWEIGMRSQLFDRRVTFNLTAFNTRYKNFQSQGIETFADGTQNFRLRNVGRLRTRGIETEATARLGRLSLGASVAYVDAEIIDFPDAQCYPGQTAAQGCTGTPQRQNLAGTRPPQAPLWKATGNAEYTQELGAHGLLGVIGGAVSYQSKVNYALTRDPQADQAGYAIVNLTAGVKSPEHGWEIMAFVNNLTDHQYYVNFTNNTGIYGGQVATNALLPRDFRRYFGIRGSHEF